MAKLKKPLMKKQNSYSVVLQMGDFKLEAVGGTVAEAISKMKPPRLIGRINITVSNGKATHTFVYVKPILAMKVFVNKEFRDLFDKRARIFLGEL